MPANELHFSSDFKDIITYCKENKLFLGAGNPNADILIIRKEAAIDMEKNKEQHETEYLDNVDQWEQNIQNNTQFEDVDCWFSLKPTFNPLYPYKGQRNVIESSPIKGKKRGEKGTSRTWRFYQKLIDAIYHDDVESSHINFHEYSFISELNQITAPYANKIPKKDRLVSIEKRKPLFEENFFQQFPIVIVAAGHYIRDFDINLCKLFKVEYDEQASKEFSEGLKNNWINVHYNRKGESPKLLIHTNQLSVNIEKELIKRLGEITKKSVLEQVILGKKLTNK
ncbi:hypothetical protein [Myroides guanonis]|uniref:Uncharacterized protein n=1 Tax=Myroides guanonis TaxID=1150112 RepID=A0A1I3LMG3_9FLAO|nr:hypothetical protein [Myroides guanonis]SFI85666.1 hypothetical protein SAMN04487893_101387 [Myroides guanonis]